MMTKRQLLLLKLAEGCAEVAQRAAKQMQFGKYEIQPGQDLTNATRLTSEIVDLFAVIDLLANADELDDTLLPSLIDFAGHFEIDAKKDKIEKYLRLSQELGQVER
jgi:hypothetical protein